MGLKLRFLLPFLFISALVCAQTPQSPNAIKTFDSVSLSSSASATYDLKQYFSYPGVTGEVAQFNTVLGIINVEMLGTDAPLTVANFKSYITDRSYDNTIIHRSVVSPTPFIIQGGGYTATLPVNPVTAKAAVTNEFKVSNLRGTIAMAKIGGNPNSATNEWFFNLANNAANLDAQNGGFTVFGRVIGNGMSIVDAIAAVPVWNFSSSGFSEIPLRNYNLVNVTVNNFVTVTSIRIVPNFPDSATGDAVVKFSASSSNTQAATATISGSQLTVNRVGAGTATITVTATDSNGRTTSSTLQVLSAGVPVFETKPQSAQIVKGGTLALFASASSFPTYQWRRNGIAIPGATSNALVIEGVSAANAGTYSLEATNTGGTTISSDAVVTVADTSSTIISALAVRTYLGASQTMTVGFATAGERDLLVTAVGPSLPGLTAAEYIVDPKVQLFSGATMIAENNDWLTGDRARIEGLKGVGVFATGSKDAALATHVNGWYSAQVTGPGAGIVMSEVYDAGIGTDGRLKAIAVLNYSGTDNKVLIVGFIISGDTAKTVLLRGLGPTLPSGVPNRLMDPKLELYNLGGTLIASNDDWPVSLEATMNRVFGNAPERGSKDAALLVTLPPGVYMAHVKGVGDTVGQAMVEVYEVQ